MGVQKQLSGLSTILRTFVRDANKVSYHRREKSVDKGCLTGVAAEIAAVVKATAPVTAAAESEARVAASAVVATAVVVVVIKAEEMVEVAVIIITNRT